ncbi:hypothetical protein [Streptomyces sp. NPDC051016]|uniref:hypothetical protein n=1 Tax=Streptomyces sp. NPDC051016 TaxID=3365638 RepID=UPI0037A17000
MRKSTMATANSRGAVRPCPAGHHGSPPMTRRQHPAPDGPCAATDATAPAGTVV